MNRIQLCSLQDSVILIIDVQEKLFQVIHEKEKLADNLQRLVKGAQILGVPILLTEQNPNGLGPTIAAINGLIPDIKPIVKFSFSCCGEKLFMEQLKTITRKNIFVAGIESHICVYQSCIDLLNMGYTVHTITDCISSRTPENRSLGIQRAHDAGAMLTGTEMMLFELLKTAENDKFKAISRIIK
jgi:nicotinamidase-related amidase